MVTWSFIWQCIWGLIKLGNCLCKGMVVWWFLFTKAKGKCSSECVFQSSTWWFHQSERATFGALDFQRMIPPECFSI